MDATSNDPLKVCLVFSSVAGFSGNVGQADYAAANAALDGFADQYRTRAPNTLVKSLAWGPWRGGMVSSALEAHFEAAGVSLIELTDGAQWMIDELSDPGQPRAILGDEPTLGALAPSAAPSYALHVSVGEASHPELVDHAVSGPPVIPVVWVNEWMLRTLHSLNPSAAYLAIEDLRVRRGVRLDSWPAVTHFQVVATPNSDGSYALALIDAEGGIRYTANGRELTDMPPVPAPASGLPVASTSAPYGGVLFHGPRFQALQPLEHLGTEGAIGNLVGASDLGWTASAQRTDPARLDGALQLAVLVTEKLIDGASLPTRIGRVAVDVRQTASGGGRAFSLTQERSIDQVTHTLVVEDGAGKLAALFEEVETTRRPNWTGAR